MEMTASRGSPRSASIRSSASAWGTERGKPSSRKPPTPGAEVFSRIIPTTDGVRHQLAGVHVPLRLAPQVAALRHGRPEQVAGGEVQQPELVAEPLGLRPLPGAGRAEQDQPGYFRNPSYERIISWASIWRIVSRATPTTIRIEVPPRTPKNTFESGR